MKKCVVINEKDNVAVALVKLLKGEELCGDKVECISDGENTDYPSLAEFSSWYEATPEVQGIPVYAILFGEASRAEMEQLAQLTGGRVFDAENGDLTAAFKEIRGYL